MSTVELKELITREINRIVDRYNRTYKDYDFICDISVNLKVHPAPLPIMTKQEYIEKKEVGPIGPEREYVVPPPTPVIEEEKVPEKLEILDVIKPRSPNNSSSTKRAKVIKPREKKITDEKGRQWTSDKVKLKADFMRYQYVRYKEQCKEQGIKPDYHKHFMKLVTDVYHGLTDEEKVNNNEIQWV